MALFQEEKILQENQHAQFELQSLEIGESIAVYFDNTRTANSEEYGEFIICQGLKIDLSAASEDDLIASATPVSFVPNTLLRNKLDQNSMIKGELYRIEKAWEKGQKFNDGKRAKGNGYELFHLKAGEGLLKAMKKAYNEKLGAAPALKEENTSDESAAKAKPRT